MCNASVSLMGSGRRSGQTGRQAARCLRIILSDMLKNKRADLQISVSHWNDPEMTQWTVSSKQTRTSGSGWMWLLRWLLNADEALHETRGKQTLMVIFHHEFKGNDYYSLQPEVVNKQVHQVQNKIYLKYTLFSVEYFYFWTLSRIELALLLVNWVCVLVYSSTPACTLCTCLWTNWHHTRCCLPGVNKSSFCESSASAPSAGGRGNFSTFIHNRISQHNDWPRQYDHRQSRITLNPRRVSYVAADTNAMSGGGCSLRLKYIDGTTDGSALHCAVQGLFPVGSRATVKEDADC